MADRKPLVLIDGIPQGLPSGDTVLVEKIRASTGILFGSDTSSANTLDDYEEGNWTPVFTSASGKTATITGATNLGTYTKIGDRVTVSINQMHWTAISGAFTTTVRIEGLPFTVGSRASAPISASTGLSLSSSSTVFGVIAEFNQTYILFVQQKMDNGTYNLDGPVVASTGVIYGLSITYLAA